MKAQRRRSSEELGRQWAGGRDVWLRVPGDEPNTFVASVVTAVPAPPRAYLNREEDATNNNTMLTQSLGEVIPADDDNNDYIDNDNDNDGENEDGNNNDEHENDWVSAEVLLDVSSQAASSNWPRIVQESVLFGLGACNPMGQELEDANTPVNTEANHERHEALYKELVREVKYAPPPPLHEETPVLFWDAFGVWADGSFEPGYCLAVPDSLEAWGLTVALKLAKKYEQGAIYRFRYIETTNTVRRRTIAVLEDPDCESGVELVRVEDEGIDLSRFAEFTDHAVRRRSSAAVVPSTVGKDAAALMKRGMVQYDSD